MSEEKQLYGADLVVDSLINHDVDYVFGIPGAKIDRVFDTLEDNCVTVRFRDTMEQERIKISELKDFIEKSLEF